MKATLQRWLQPSLARRLVLAQMATVAVLWAALASYTSIQLSNESSVNDLELMRAGASVVLPLASALQGQPDLLQQTLRRLDEFQRSNVVSEGGREVLQLPRIYLWHDTQLVYRSSDAEADLRLDATGLLLDVTVNNLTWHAYAEDSADKRWRFAALAPASAEASGLLPWSRAWLVTPLLFSLPLLLIPAWWSVRVALRPWAHLSGEIASRGPDDLSPLRFAPLHRELSPLTRAVNQLLERLRLSRERERSFIADAAHELRTPIAAMQINAEALYSRRSAPGDRELLNGLLKSNERASRLVSQLLALMRSGASPELHESAEVDMQAVVQESLAEWAPMARTQNIELDLESCLGARVWGDQESLRILVDNVVGNAIKYSPQGATVRVIVSCADNVVQVDVLDEGPGIDADLRVRVFDRFYRMPGQRQAGSGLGLAIAKTVADKHGATLKLSDGFDSRGLRVILRMTAYSKRQG
jgi:two-component system sensor histidine kinase QseC